MTVIGYDNSREKLSEPYTVIPHENNMTNIPVKMKKTEVESANNSKVFWIKITGIYLVLFSLTICVIGTLGYGHRILNKISDNCRCSSNSKEILLRIEELERKINSFEKYSTTANEYVLQENSKYVDYSNDRSLRSKRQIDRQLIEDGVPIEFDRGKNESRATEGLRIYDSWYQKSNSIPISRNGRNMNGGSNANEAIRPHHRKSASWVEEKRKRRKRKKHNLNAHFDDNSIYRKGRRGRKRTGGSSNRSQERQSSREIDAVKYARRSRVSITATESSRSIPAIIPPITTKAPISNRNLVRSLDSGNKQHHSRRRNHAGHGRQLGIHHRVSSSSINSLPTPLPLVENVNIAPAPNRKLPLKSSSMQLNGGSIADKFSGLKSVHFVGKLDSPPVDGNYRNQEVDGKFRHWKLARWGKKMHLDSDFPINNGTIRVKQPGVYYVYAQINYLDEHDVNAFQVLLNDDPFLLCTVMTHTGRSHTISKANTCYTGGVSFMEADDEISIRDLEVGRHSVIRPAHTFFGLIQLSGLQP